MGQKTTRTYIIKGQRQAFYFSMFRKAFSEQAAARGVGITPLELELGNAVGVSQDAVHQWRFGHSAPGDLETVSGIARFLGLALDDLLITAEEDSMDKLTDRQRDSIARIYKEIADYLLVFEQADGFVWNNYRIKAGSPLLKYTITSNELVEDGETIVFADGADYGEAAWRYARHALEREWVELGNHPLYEELYTFIDDYLLEIWSGKTDPDYRFEPNETDELRGVWVDAERARKAAREIIGKYL